MSELRYLRFTGFHTRGTKQNKKISLQSILCISGGSEQLRSEFIKELYNSRNGGSKRIQLVNENGESVVQHILLAQDRNKYLKKHSHQGLFFQQRFQSAYADIGDTVKDVIYSAQQKFHFPDFLKLLDILEVQPLLEKPLIQLSSGEWQRYTFMLNIIKKPDILLFEDGLKGLDSRWRNNIIDLFLSGVLPVPTLIFTSDNVLDEIPTEYKLHLGNQYKETSGGDPGISDDLRDLINSYYSSPKNPKVIVRMDGVNIQYGTKKVLQNIRWEVKSGESWKIQGHNGAGKSTLLSLIYGDNPQAYSQPVYLFGRKKGSGQSIWELKSKISYFSSDLFQYFNSKKSGWGVIQSEMKTPHIESNMPAEELIFGLADYFEITEHLDTPFSRLNPNVRRQVLLIATYLKSSELIILDEPYHGFDNKTIARNNRLIEYIISNSNQALLFVSHYSQYFPEDIMNKLVLNEGEIHEITIS